MTDKRLQELREIEGGKGLGFRHRNMCNGGLIQGTPGLSSGIFLFLLLLQNRT